MASGDSDCQPTRIAFSKRCSPENPYVSVRKVVGLMEDPISAEAYDRQLIIINDFIDACTYAFWVRDLPFIMRLLELLIERLDKMRCFREPLELLLSLCGVPPMLIRTSEAIKYNTDIQHYFSFLGYQLVYLQDEPKLQDMILRAISELLDRKAPVGICCVTLKTCYSAVEKSQLPKVITHLMEIVEENLYIKLLNVALILVNISPVICQRMIREKAIDHLLVRLDPSWKTRNKNLLPPDPDEDSTVQHFEITSKILWTLLSAFKHQPDEFKKSVTTPNLQAIWSLRYALQVLIKHKRSELNRNHLMGILLQCLKIFPDIVTIRSGLARDLVILSTATELGTGGTWAAQVHFTANEIDYDFKKMLLLAICYCAKHVNPIQILLPKRMIPALLKIITPELNTIWHPQQHSKLMSLTLHALVVLGQRIPNEFLYYDGPLRLLLLIDYYNVEPYDAQLLQDCLKLLHSISSMENQNISHNLLLNEANTVLRSICENLLSNKILTLVIQQCLAYAFATFELLCKAQNASEPCAVNLSLKFMKRIINQPAEDPVYDPKFLICAIGFLWEGVIWCESNLKLFIPNGGVFAFLDFIQKSVFPVKMVALGALVDMCNEGTCIPHLITWRKNGQTLLPMLLELFREENFKLGVKTTAKGTVEDIEAPIMGSQQWHETFYEYKDPNSSPAVVDLLGSCRPKIYALIQLLTDRHEIRTDIANEHYCMYDNNNLNTQDQITLLLAENFLALKLGEAWVELSKDIQKQGIRPLAINGEILAILTHRFHKWALHIKTLQEALIEREREKEGIKERLLYNTLRDSKLVESLKALHELDYIARTTERMFRLVRKMKQSSEIEKSLAFTEGSEHHTTFMHKIQVNPVFNQQVSVQSNIIVEPNNDDFDLSPVSSDCESNNYSEQHNETETGVTGSEPSCETVPL